MRRHLVTLAIIAVFIIGLSVLLYPYIADYFNSRNQSRAVASYKEAVSSMSEQDLSGLREAARLYNEALSGKPDRFLPTQVERLQYNSLLNVTTAGIMGTLEIDAIGVSLPIYHGTSEGVLQVGIGHFEGSSLPIGGVGTHAVITGHRGLPSSLLLTNLDRVVIGDTFVLQVLGESLWYRVDKIIVVEPDDLSSLAIDPQMDYCTLITCTPYGINSHRLLVRGFRIEAPDPEAAEAAQALTVPAEARKIGLMLPLAATLLPAFVIVAAIQIIRLRKRSYR